VQVPRAGGAAAWLSGRLRAYRESGAGALVAQPLDEAGQGTQEQDGASDAFVMDTDYASEATDLVPSEPIGRVKYFGPVHIEGAPILLDPDGDSVDVLMPGEVVAAEVPSEGGHARLLDNRGWLALDDRVEEVHPWAARIMKKPGIDMNDAAALAYLSMDTEGLSPLAEHLPLPSRVINALERQGITSASPIQESVFSSIYRGQSMCIQSQTGSGKTLAMMLPLLTSMAEESEWGANGDKIVVVTSCRELAVQLFAEIDSMGFFPQGRGYATLLIVGNVPSTSAILNANIIIGTPNELGGVLHKDRQLIAQMNTKLRAIVMDEVDDYTTAPKLFASKYSIKRKRRRYNERKQTLSNRLGDYDTGKIEWFVKRSLAFSRRRDLQVLAASATLSRNMARKVYRLLRWDPLGRWYDNAPPLMRPLTAMNMDWQSVPRMPTVPLHVQHRYVPVVKAKTDINVTNKHYTRKPVNAGGLPRLRLRNAYGREKGLFGQAGRPITNELAASLMDGLHDALKSRGQGSAMLIICRTAGITVRDAVKQLHEWGFYEAEAINEALWTDPKDWPSRWAIKYTYDQRDHAAELAEKHHILSERLRTGEHVPLPVASPEWRVMEQRKAAGEATSPILVGFEGVGRGLHFEGAETAYILGLPRKPSIYMHLAGRVGRLGQRGGKVISVVPLRGAKVLQAWQAQIGPGVRFQLEPGVMRIRSRPMPVNRPPRPLSERRARRPQRRRHAKVEEDEEDEEDEEEDEERTKRLLLTEGMEYLPVPGFDEQGEHVQTSGQERIMEAARYSRQREDVAKRRIAARLSRTTRSI